jgi:hypothetical protein
MRTWPAKYYAFAAIFGTARTPMRFADRASGSLTSLGRAASGG